MQIKSYESAVKYLEGFIGKIRFEITPDFLKHHDPLERMRILLSILGNPQEKFKSVLVGGTSGKGSTAYLISHILTTAGYKTGFTLSPHLEKINERIQINGQSISDENFVKLLNTPILSSIGEMSKMSIGPPSYFEILIAMAFLYFAEQKVDIVVAEVGMGGEYDATNTLNPLIAVLTNVGLDHTNILGKTVEKIAKTKAGIIKKVQSSKFKVQSLRQQIVVTGIKQPSVIKIVEDRCKEVGAKLFRLGKDFNFKIKKEDIGGSVLDLTTTHDRGLLLNDLNITLLGKYQVENASLAIETVRQLADFGFKVSEEHIREALKTAFFPGRFEIIPVISFQSSVVREQSIGSRFASLGTDELKTDKPKSENRKQRTDNRLLILDGAHNPTKMKVFTYSLKTLYPKVKKIFIVGFKFDKDIPEMLQQITKVADKIIVTEFNRAIDMSKNASADALKIRDQILKIKYDGEVVVEKDSKKALKIGLKAIQQYNNSAILVVAGSLYLVGEIRNKL